MEDYQIRRLIEDEVEDAVGPLQAKIDDLERRLAKTEKIARAAVQAHDRLVATLRRNGRL